MREKNQITKKNNEKRERRTNNNHRMKFYLPKSHILNLVRAKSRAKGLACRK